MLLLWSLGKGSLKTNQWHRTMIPFRCFSATQCQQRDNGPPQNKLRAIPFTQHIKAAETVFDDYHGNGFFSVRVVNTGPPEEIFLPFWVVSAKVQVQLKQAQVGKNTIERHYNPATKRTEQVYTTEWAWVPYPEQYKFERQYAPEKHVDLQVYGSFRYRRGLVNGIRQTNMTDIKPFTPDLMDRPDYRDMDEKSRRIERRVDPFTIYPTTALRLAKSYIQSNEEKEMDRLLCDTYGADKTRLVDLAIKITDIHVSPVYYPAYVFSVHYLNRRLRTFVNGNNLAVNGVRAYNWKRAAACSALGMTAITLANGGIGWGGYSGSFWIGIVLPSFATAVMVMYYPLIYLRIQDAIRQHEIKSQLHDQKIWDADWTEAFDSFESGQRYRAWRSEQTQQQRTGSMDDPKGYYAALNVSPNATKADIQSAFRGLAMKYHPDRYTDPKEKTAAKEKFQVISNAYSVLRDSKKRNTYDKTGTG